MCKQWTDCDCQFIREDKWRNLWWLEEDLAFQTVSPVCLCANKTFNLWAHCFSLCKHKRAQCSVFSLFISLLCTKYMFNIDFSIQRRLSKSSLSFSVLAFFLFIKGTYIGLFNNHHQFTFFIFAKCTVKTQCFYVQMTEL